MGTRWLVSQNGGDLATGPIRTWGGYHRGSVRAELRQSAPRRVRRIGNGLRAHVLTGVVIFTFQGRGNDFIRDTLTWRSPSRDYLPVRGLHVEQWAPFVTPASIGNEGPALNPGWAVDGFRLENTGPVITVARVTCDLAVRDQGSYLYRAAYSLHLTGQFDGLP